MSSIVCQGLMEPCVLRHKLDPPKSNFPQTFQNHQEENQQNSHSEEENKNNGFFPDGDHLKSNKNGGLASWSFIQALTTKSQNFQEPAENEKVYVHPLVKRSSSTLSKKSLEMCTESLGSETGSDISESSDELFSSLSRESVIIHQPSKSRECFAKKTTRSGSSDFPPPLGSISGSESVQVSLHREGGRLVLKAFTVAASKTYFQAERVNGRLRLSLLENSSLNCDNGVVDDDDDDDVDDDGDVDDDEEDGDYHDDGDDDDDDGTWVEDMGGNGGNVGCEKMELEELPRPSRCKEGGGGSKGISSWKPFLKALC